MKDLVCKFLQESVFAAREAQHSEMTAGAGGCGLGARPVIPETFTAKQAAIMEEMMAAASVAPERLVEVAQQSAERWIKIQDGLDRKRNHFLKDFRQGHGFDRRAYPPEIDAQFQSGIDEINQENRERLDREAEAFLQALS